MVMCARCHKRMAVVFITRVDDGESKQEGICIKCAKELGIKPVEDLMKQFGVSVDEIVLDRVIRHGTADISQRYLTAIWDTATEYAEGIFRRLREHEYDPELMRLYVVGGGSCILKNFGSYDKDRVTINDDICATAKGYELLAEQKQNRKGGIV